MNNRVTIAALCLFLASALSWAQAKPEFDAASVKPNKSVEIGGARSNLLQRGSHVIIVRFSLRMLLGQAYDLRNLSDATNRIIGAPGWADSEYFDVEATMEMDPGSAQKRVMLQSLLNDRFNLALHHETRQRPVYALVQSKPNTLGPQLKVHTDDGSCTDQLPCGRVVGGLVPRDPSRAWSGGRKVTMEMVAASLGGMEIVDRPVIDRTGMIGMFDFTIEWNTQLQTLSVTPLDSSGTTLAQALRQQLGLKLVAQTSAVDVLVIDQVDRPKPN
jgi:uncharacterized protein (TIGR03435 family)